MTFNPVLIDLHGIGKYKPISTVEQAFLCLVEEWPTMEGVAFVNALIACQAALDGSALPSTARAAFVRAATEADITTRGELLDAD